MIGDIQIPASQRAAFALVARMDQAKFQKLLKALDQRPEGSLSSFASILADGGAVNRTEARQILAMLLSLFSLLDDHEAELSDLLGSLTAALEEDREAFSKEEVDRVLDFLTNALSLEELGLFCKAKGLGGEAQRTYCYSRVLTDVRPVFKSGTSDAAAALIVHTIKIAYHEDSGRLKEVFIGMSPADIVRLQSVLSRATVKENSLRGIHAQPGALPILEVD